jgi:hypothetical protein
MVLPVLTWLFRAHGVTATELTRPNLGILPKTPKGLADRVRAAIAHSPCDLVFVHRDAETVGYSARAEEVAFDLNNLNLAIPHVRVIPVRMSEAWLLIDERSIRKVAQRPNGRVPLSMPRLAQLESLPDPKRTLLNLLTNACELKGRRLDQFKLEARARIHQLAEFIPDFSPLRSLSAFQALEMEFQEALARLQ